MFKNKYLNFNNDNIVFKLGLIAWVVIYFTYILTHEIPVNPAGFYLASAKQLAQNGFQLPKNVTGFGDQGVPFAYPPLGVYLYALVGNLFGNMSVAALLVPGLLLPIQAFAAYLFVKQFTGSSQAAQWSAVFLLLVPHMVNRTLYGDGITTGLSGIFLLLSWYFAVKPTNKSNYFQNHMVAGFWVGLSILSHPGLGLFCAVTFTILFISQAGVTVKSIIGLIISGISALALALFWLVPVISMHGLDPILASTKDTKSSLSILMDIDGSVSYMYEKHFEDLREGLGLFLFPVALAVLYSIIYGPRISLLLLLAGVFTFKGHPSVTMFVFSLNIGVFYDALSRMFGNRRLDSTEQSTSPKSVFEFWGYPVFVMIQIGALFLISMTYALSPSFASGEQETYSWIKNNTNSNATFLIEDVDENLVYFAQRNIMLPVWGAEWIPDSKYGNGSMRSDYIKSEVFSCRESECLFELFSEHGVFPDYIVFRVDDEKERDWINALSTSDMFELEFTSGDMVTFRCTKCLIAPATEIPNESP